LEISLIKLKDFRNLSEQEIYPQQGINIIHGNNGQGKTNLLEAIWISTGGRSFRGVKDSDLIKFNEKTAESTIEFYARKRGHELKTIISAQKREIFLNSIAKVPISSAVGEFISVIFSPNHLSIINGGPGSRRNFLDTAICQIKPIYAKILLQYRHVLNQRNSLLRSLNNKKNLIETIDIWDGKLADCGATIRLERAKYSLSLQELLKKTYSESSLSGEKIEVFYRGPQFSDKTTDTETLKEGLLKELQRSQKKDISCGFTNKGPHRDELEIQLNHKAIRLFGSQGQQRSAILAIKMAEAEILREATGESPVILLDDVMSELDPSRQNFILDFLKHGQVFITCCRPIDINDTAYKNFELKNGRISN
jgi:DNA replication and repair protein RecF